MLQENNSHRPTEQLRSHLDARRVHEHDPNSNKAEALMPLPKDPAELDWREKELPRLRDHSTMGFLTSRASSEDSWDSPTRTSEATLMI